VVVDESKVEIGGTEIFVWTAVDFEILEVLDIDVTPGRSSLNALLFFRGVLHRYCGRP
jgi:putative transposase